jgi:hypothetical protein
VGESLSTHNRKPKILLGSVALIVLLLIPLPWLHGSSIGGAAYMTIQNAGSSLVQRSILNFTGSTISCADDSVNSRTTCTVSAGTPNPLVYKTMVNQASSCPSSEASLASYRFPASASVGAGDSISVTVWFQKTGVASTPAINIVIDGTYANDPGDLGAVTMGSSVYSMYTTSIVLSGSSITYNTGVSRNAGGLVFAAAPLFTGATITSTPLVDFRASGCSGGDTIQVVGAVITLSKAASL